jgi:hypothetical protein
MGRIGVRAAVVGVGVFASLAIMAAPSWAANRADSEKALCKPGGYPGVLLEQDASAFTNRGKCNSYVAKDGQLVGLNTALEPPVGDSFNETCSGFGLKPDSMARCGARYVGSQGIVEVFGGTPVREDGTWSIASDDTPCEQPPRPRGQGTKITSLVVQATTAEGTLFERQFPPPSGC